jgi:acetylornithine deacetylase/succinyl-diaminopimelate desuccinylase-like protein
MANAPGQKRPDPSGVVREIFAQTRTTKFQKYLRDLLVRLCRVDTTPKPEPELMQQAEDSCFRLIEKELNSLAFQGGRVERRLINPAIKSHPCFSLLHFTKTPDRPNGLSASRVYAHRSSLLYFLPGKTNSQAGRSVALNAHIDVVAPYFPPRIKAGTVFGRGACDDKGPVVSILAALKILSEAMARAKISWNRNVLGMFVVEEETGGNGSLSLAVDRELKKLYDSVLVCECTGLKFYPANRGAVWYRARLRAPEGISALELFAFINEEMEKEGSAIRAESQHPLFPQRPVQTCHGMIGSFGEHPSRICGQVSFLIRTDRRPNEELAVLVNDCLEAGLTGYVGLYGDKTKVSDPSTAKPMVRKHYELRRLVGGFQIDVYGATGHMGAIRERDGAITKMAHLIRSLVSSKPRLEAVAKGPVQFVLASTRSHNKALVEPASGRKVSESSAAFELILEGGQGFIPTHTMQEVMERLRQAAERGAENCLRRFGRSEQGRQVVHMAYEKLHNDAFDGNPHSASVKNAIAAAQSCGIWRDEPTLGWTVSCDARLFAREYPGLEVLTFGPGRLVHAHSDQEQIAIEELQRAAEFLAVFLLLQTGTITL